MDSFSDRDTYLLVICRLGLSGSLDTRVRREGMDSEQPTGVGLPVREAHSRGEDHS